MVACSPSTGGPVQPSGTTSLLSIPVPPGEELASGDHLVKNQGDDIITLESAHLSSEDLAADAPRVVKTWAMDNTPFTAGVVGTPDAPIDDLLMPLVGFQVAPGAYAQVVFILDVEHKGRWQWEGFTVEYSYKGRHYRADLPNGIRICSPGLPRTPCV